MRFGATNARPYCNSSTPLRPIHSHQKVSGLQEGSDDVEVPIIGSFVKRSVLVHVFGVDVRPRLQPVDSALTHRIPRIEFSPANKKEKRTCSPLNVFSTECVLYRMCSPRNVFFIECVLPRFLRTKNNNNKVFTFPLTKRGDFAFLRFH
jgi:hypothetical protein